ncbi:retrovirus-related pol polyprotein from transposon TNT 1-94 [Tanacetum coccineum]|uniref:Retrovirus-related pol polyprotein from transposon TNT 1-94 n=1 Tax=Tanacetum coccineum TaxID=301880 RepID=A0ABQ4WG10_9ASTR
MTTLAKHIIVAGAENRSLMLEKSMYDSWASRIRLFIQGKKHGRMMLDSIDNVDYDVQQQDILPLSSTRLYNLFDKFTYVQGETLYPDPLALVANSPTLYNPSQSPQHSGSLMYPPPQQFTPVYAAPIHHQHHHTLVNPQQHSVSPQPFISPSVTQQSQAEFPQLDSSLAVPMFQQGEDPIECINKAMAFLSAVASRFPPSNNQLRTSSNPRNQATIQDGRVTVQQVQGRQTQSYAGTRNRGIATTSKRNFAAGQPRVVKCYNCQGEGHMARQCTQPKRPRNAAWFKEKLMLAEAQEAGQILDEEQLAFLADPGISEAPVAQQTIPQNLAFQTEDLDAYDSDCDDLSSAKAVQMANISSCDPEVLSEVPYSNSYPNDMINQDVQEMHYSKQIHIDDFQDNEIHSDSNTISYSQYQQESQNAVIQDTNSSAPNDLLVLSLVEQMTDHVAHLDKENQTNKMQEIDTLKETISNNVKEKQSLSTTLTVFKTECKEKESKYMDKEIVLENKNKELENTLCKVYRSMQAMHMLMKSQVHDVIFVIDDKETLILEKESRSKMLDKQNDQILIKQKINISPIDYLKLNKIKEDFGKRFVTKKELSAEQAFWLKHLNYNSDTSVKSHTLVRIEAPSELPKVSFVNESLKKLKYQLASFDKVLKKRTTSDAITAEFVHIAVNSVDILNVNKSCVDECNKCLKLETELLKKKDLIEKDVYDNSVEHVKKDIDEIETINIELEHNQFDSIRKTRVQSKEHSVSLIAQINAKSVKNLDLNAQLQEKIFAIAALKNKLRKLKGKNVVDNAVSKPSATIAPGIFKLDIEPISHRLKNNRNAHDVYLEKTIENTNTICGLVECARKHNPSEPLLESTCMFAKHVQELLVYVSKTCPSLTKPTEKLVVVTQMNKDKKVKFVKPVTSSRNISKQTDSHRTKYSNKTLLTSIGVNTTTSASGSKPSGNTKKNRI